MSESNLMPVGLRWRLIFTIYGSIAWLIFIIAYLSFVPTNFTVWQDIAIVVISLLVLAGVISGVWIPWNPGMIKQMEAWGKSFEKFKK